MKYGFLCSIFCLLIMPGYLQAQEFSVVGGMNVSNMSTKVDGSNLASEYGFQPRIGGHLGGLIDLKFGKVFSIEPGLIFITKGFKFDHTFQLDNGKKYDYSYKFRPFYLDIPVIAKVNWNPKERFRVYGGLGPVFSIGLFGNRKTAFSSNEITLAEVEAQYPGRIEGDGKIRFGDEIKRHDVGLMFTAGINVAMVRIGAFYTQGLTNVTYDHSTARNRVVGVHVGYTFAFRNQVE